MKAFLLLIFLVQVVYYLDYFFLVLKTKITFWYGIYRGNRWLWKVTVLPLMDGKYGSGPGYRTFLSHWRPVSSAGRGRGVGIPVSFSC